MQEINNQEDTKGLKDKKRILKLAGLGAAFAVTGVAGYYIGYHKCYTYIVAGLSGCCNVDPTLGPHMMKAIEEAKAHYNL